MTNASFADYSLDPLILKSLEKMGFEKPSPIQAETLPIILEGLDVIGLAETGSGKTAACAIPVCQMVDTTSAHIQALIVVPTRELCLQYAMETQKIGGAKGVKAYALYGGGDADLQLAKLRSGVQVLVATPGRLIDLIYRRQIDLAYVSTLILDEADEMLSMGFIEDLEMIMDCLVQEHQTLLFSATMNKEVEKIASHRMKSPRSIKLTSKRKAPANLAHKFIYVRNYKARPTVLLNQILEQKPNQCLVFCRSRIQTEEVCRELRKKMRDVDFLHGGLNQNLRMTITDKFRRGRMKTLCVTDVAARGLDFSGVTHVFIYELGKDIDAYVHRTGRTGRSGREGTAITLVTDRERGLLTQVLKKIDKKPIWIGDPMPAKRSAGRGNRPRR